MLSFLGIVFAINSPYLAISRRFFHKVGFTLLLKQLGFRTKEKKLRNYEISSRVVLYFRKTVVYL